MQKVIPAVVMLIMVVCSVAKGEPPVKEKRSIWQPWETVTSNFDAQQKPVLIDVYTDWCHYCRMMDANTYKNDSVITYLNNNFYRYKFNAETKDSIEWRNKVFKYNTRYGVNDFAVYLTHGNIVYPTTVVIVPGGQPYFFPGELKPNEMEIVLKYFGEGAFKTTAFEDYQKNYINRWK